MGSGSSTIKSGKHGIIQRHAVESDISGAKVDINKQRVADLPNNDNGKLKQGSDGTPTDSLSTNMSALTISTNQTSLPQGLDMENDSFDYLIGHQSMHKPQTAPKQSPHVLTNSMLSQNTSALTISTNQTSIPQRLGNSIIAHQAVHQPQTIPKRPPHVITNNSLSTNTSALTISTNQRPLPQELDMENDSFDSLIGHQSMHIPQTAPKQSPNVLTNSMLSQNTSALTISTNQTSIPQRLDNSIIAHQAVHQPQTIPKRPPHVITNNSLSTNTSALTISTNQRPLPQELDMENDSFDSLIGHQSMHIPQTAPKQSPNVLTNSFEIKSNPVKEDTSAIVQEDKVNCDNDKEKIPLDISTGVPSSNLSALTVNTNEMPLAQRLGVEERMLHVLRGHQATHQPQTDPKRSVHVRTNN